MESYVDVENEEAESDEEPKTTKQGGRRISRSESGAGVEGKFRLSLENIEKRFVDLELIISEIREHVNSIKVDEKYKKDVKEVKQRMDDIEDLIMVEQAGIVELKNIMKGVDEKLDTSALEYKITEIENLAKGAVESLKAGAEVPPEISVRIGEFSNRIEGLENKIAQLQVRPGVTPEIGEQIASLQREIEVLKKTPGLEYMGHMELGELKNNFKIIVGKIEELSIAVEGLEKDVYERIKLTEQPPIDTADLEAVKSSLGMLKANFESLNERRAEDDLKLASLEGRVGVLKTIVEGIDRGEGGGVSLGRYANQLEASKAKIETLEMAMNQIKSEMQTIERTIGEFRISGGVESLRRDVQEKLMRLEAVEEQIDTVSQRVEVVYNDINARMESTESKKPPEIDLSVVKNTEIRMEHKFNERLKEIGKAVGDMTNTFEEITTAYKEIDVVKKDIEMLNKEITAVRNLVTKIAKYAKPKEGEPKKLGANIDDLGARTSELENSVADINLAVEKITKGKQTVHVEEAYMKEIIDKLVFLESRVASIESMFESPRPIIIE